MGIGNTRNARRDAGTRCAAARRLVIAVDGFTVSVAAALLAHLQVRPLLNLGMRLGEGSGAGDVRRRRRQRAGRVNPCG